MRKKRILFGLLALAFLIGATTAEAGVLNDLGRYLGWGWSDGYHAKKPGLVAGPGDHYAPPPGGVRPMYSGRGAPPVEVRPQSPQALPMSNSGRGAPLLPSRTAVPKPVPLTP